METQVRARGPDTSHEAAAAFAKTGKAQRSVAVVVQILKTHCAFPLTDFQIRDLWTEYWGSDKWSFTLPCKARHWAREQGLVKQAGYGEHLGNRVQQWTIGRDDAFFAREVCPACSRPLRKTKKAKA